MLVHDAVRLCLQPSLLALASRAAVPLPASACARLPPANTGPRAPRLGPHPRTAITLAYRGAYLAFTSCPAYGLGACAVGSYAWHHGATREGGESAFSAMLWRSGIIGMVRAEEHLLELKVVLCAGLMGCRTRILYSG